MQRGFEFLGSCVQETSFETDLGVKNGFFSTSNLSKTGS